MTAAPNLIRAFLAAAVCVVAFALLAPSSFAQVVEPPPADPGPVVVDPPPVDPPADPAPPVEPPADPAPPVEPPADPAPPVDPPADPPVAVHADPEPVQRPDPPAREQQSTREPPTPASPTTQTPTSSITVSEPLAAAAPVPLPPAAPGEDWAWTDQGDAFVLGTGGSDGGGEGAVLGSFTRFASIATAAARIPVLNARARGAHNAGHAGNSGAGLVLVDSSGNTMLFFNLFGGGGGGGAALVLLTALGLLTVARMLPPDWRAFREATAIWRPSAYVPPIEHPG
jgi:hypothetical protein